jgi:hypothetical protein
MMYRLVDGPMDGQVWDLPEGVPQVKVNYHPDFEADPVTYKVGFYRFAGYSGLLFWQPPFEHVGPRKERANTNQEQI